MSDILPRYRDRPVSYQGGGVFVAGHDFDADGEPVTIFKGLTNSQNLANYQAAGSAWVSANGKECVSWWNYDFSISDRRGYFYRKGSELWNLYASTHRIVCCAMPTKDLFVVVEMEYETNKLFLTKYQVSYPFNLTRLSTRHFYDYGKVLTIIDPYYRIFGGVAGKFCHCNFVLAQFMTDGKTLIMVDKVNTDESSFLVKVLFGDDYNTETITEIPLINNEPIVDMAVFKDSFDFVSLAVTGTGDYGTNSIQRICRLTNDFSLESVDKQVETVDSIRRDFIYINSRKNIFVTRKYEFFDTTPATSSLTIYADINDALHTINYQSPVTYGSTAYDYHLGVYDGKTHLIPFYILSNPVGKQKTLLIDKNNDYLVMDKSVEYKYDNTGLVIAANPISLTIK